MNIHKYTQILHKYTQIFVIIRIAFVCICGFKKVNLKILNVLTC